MLTREQGEALAHLVHLLRPEWDKAGILAALGRCRHRNELDVSMAAIRAAAATEIRTPGAIATSGDHWRERVSPVVAPRPPKPADACKVCGRHEHAPDAVCDTPSWRPPTPAANTTEQIARLRRQLNHREDA